MNMRLRFPVLGFTAALLAACAAPSLPPPSAAPVQHYLNARSEAPLAVTEQWWRGYHDPLLDRLVQRALDDNLDLQVALARIDAARALRAVSAAAGSPALDFGASAARQRTSAYQTGYSEALIDAPISLGLGASWELDLFGRIREGVRAADAEVTASEEQAHAVKVALVGEVVQAYAQARGLEQRLEIVRQSAQSQAETLQLTEQLYAAGSSPEADLLRARAQADRTAARVPALRLEWQRTVHRLSVLLAMSSAELYGQMHANPASVREVALQDAGTPADLLRRRPDVKAAEARVVAAYARVGVAKAELMPRLSLSAALGSLINGMSAATLANSTFWLAGVNASAPLFDGGRRKAQVQVRDAEAREALLSYRRTVLVAVSEVESALAAAQRNAERQVLLARASEQSTSAFEQIRRSWQAGEAPFLDVLEAQRNQLSALDALATVRTAQWQNQVALVSALGG
ncbi:efflux transporter outer membrane subunit [Pseudomonas asiatica]|uniref:efflux transporter outer membrane subunit n=1 Tax=Pseudomonas asiatica TaxID=2219225 RepID=UPI0018A95AEF|nr:efflux transporter outer membrane subunit [Pseudomonas asiatica]MBF8802401.1 efflux transporter outer membrane subunit [Pseudomonas asiatica]MBH3378543.1 efflux transporter outer membrane subunit [Pseudomonas asiatica]MEE1914775.1 efflux transporter outer membrane subunit [Pseudomonas asiatica]WDM86231.1 efflux transporter outer membrane subunit [Pseudomonas asiatica]